MVFRWVMCCLFDLPKMKLFGAENEVEIQSWYGLVIVRKLVGEPWVTRSFDLINVRQTKWHSFRISMGFRLGFIPNPIFLG